MRTAYVDESEPGGGLDRTVYLLAAILIEHTAADTARTALRQATPRRTRKLHRYEALHAQRISWVDLLRSAAQVPVIRYDGAVARSERRRRRCLERLLWELGERDVSHLVIETRGPADPRATVTTARCSARPEIAGSDTASGTSTLVRPTSHCSRSRTLRAAHTATATLGSAHRWWCPDPGNADSRARAGCRTSGDHFRSRTPDRHVDTTSGEDVGPPGSADARCGPR